MQTVARAAVTSPNRSASRSRISVVALLVKVIASRDSGATPCPLTSQTHGEGAGFARTRPGHNHQRPCGVGGRGPLGVVERREPIADAGKKKGGGGQEEGKKGRWDWVCSPLPSLPSSLLLRVSAPLRETFFPSEKSTLHRR